MKFKIDENLPDEFATKLRDAGFDADTVGDEFLSGSDDSTLFERCQTEGRILISQDLDFSNIRAYPPSAQAGIIVFRAKSQDKLTLLALLDRLIPVLVDRLPNHQIWIVERDRVRVRSASEL